MSKREMPESMLGVWLGPGNYYGGLEVRVKGGKAEWSVENYDGHDWIEIPDALFWSLVDCGLVTKEDMDQGL